MEYFATSGYGLLVSLGLALGIGFLVLGWCGLPRVNQTSPPATAEAEKLECSFPPEVLATLPDGELPEFVPYPDSD